MTPRPFRTVLGTILLATVLGSCGKRSPAVEEEPPVPSTRTPWVQARSSEGVPLLEAPAQVLPSPEAQAGVVPPYRARVLRVLVRPGERVTKGQALVEVVMPEVSAAAGAYAAASTRVDAYRRRKAQLDALKADGLVRLVDVLEAETKLAEALADQQSAAATLRTAQVEPAEASGIVSGRKPVSLRSPISGTVTAVGVAVGDSREPTGEPVARVAGEGDARIEARFARPVDAEQTAFEFITSGGSRHRLTFVARAPVTDPRDGTTSVWLVPEKGERLQPGLTGRVVVTLSDGGQVAVVPARSAGLSGGKAFVVARRNGKTERVPVEVIASSGAEALVRGILPGVEVAADASLADLAAPAAEKQP